MRNLFNPGWAQPVSAGSELCQTDRIHLCVQHTLDMAPNRVSRADLIAWAFARSQKASIQHDWSLNGLDDMAQRDRVGGTG